jgi:pre-mRNA-processing factor 6
MCMQHAMILVEWLQAIPEIGDHTTKKKKRETFTPVPDMLMTDAAAAGQTGNTVVGGLETPGGSSTSLTEIGQGRQMVVDISLKRAGDSVTGQSNVDPKGYLTDLGHIKISTDAEIGDIKRARTLLKSVINTNPKHAPGWVAAARLVNPLLFLDVAQANNFTLIRIS